MEYNFDNLKAFLDSVPQRFKAPSYDLKICHHGKEVFRYMGGYADRENKIPVSDATYYFIYSCSKVLTCALALKAVEEGYFLPSEDVGMYLPEFYDVMVKNYDENGNIYLVKPSRNIRIQDLFRMTSGFNYSLTNEYVEKLLKENPCAPTRDIIRALSKNNLDVNPGDMWKYSISHDILACVVEAATGIKFRDYAKQKFFDPLGMTKTKYHMDDISRRNMAKLYRLDWDKNEAFNVPLKNDYILSDDYDSGGAGIITTVDDYSKFVTAMSMGGVGENGVRILNRSTTDLMRTNLLEIGSRPYYDFISWGPSNAEYGYGFGVRTKIGAGTGGNFSSVGSFGWGGAAGALVDIDPEREISIFYCQHLLSHRENEFHPRLRNYINIALGY